MKNAKKEVAKKMSSMVGRKAEGLKIARAQGYQSDEERRKGALKRRDEKSRHGLFGKY